MHTKAKACDGLTFSLDHNHTAAWFMDGDFRLSEPMLRKKRSGLGEWRMQVAELVHQKHPGSPESGGRQCQLDTVAVDLALRRCDRSRLRLFEDELA